MPRFCVWTLLWGLCLTLAGAALAADRIGPTENLFPATTKGFVAVADVDTLIGQWHKTQIGQLMDDPVMEPFAQDLRRQLESRLASRLGLTMDDLWGVPGGEIGLALIQPGPSEGVVVLVVDVTGHLPQARAMLAKVAGELTKQGAKQIAIPAGPITVVQFDLAKTPGDPQAKPRKAFYVLSGNMLAVSDHLQEIQAVLARATASSPAGTRLADVPAFRAVMGRCAKDNGGVMPQIRWFVDPLDYMELVRTASVQPRRAKGKPLVEILRNQGFEALQGVGGFVDFAAEGFEMTHRTSIFAPPPYETSMKMLVFPTGKNFAPQAWVPRDVATYDTGYVDIMNAFDNFGPLFDEVYGQGEKGVWDDVKESIKTDPNGAQIDLRKDLIQYLGPRVTVLSDYQLPITPTSERLLFAIETPNPAALTAAINRTMEFEPTAKPHKIKGHLFDGQMTPDYVVWEMVEEEGQKIKPVDIRAIPPLSFGRGEGSREEAEEALPRVLPHAAVTVVHGHLFIASHMDFLTKVLEPAQARETLGRSVDYRMVEAAISQQAVATPCAKTFSRTDEEYRPAYELIRQGKMPESEAMFGRLLNALLSGSKPGGVRTQRVVGAKLPEFDVVRRYLGPTGMVVGNEPNGWFIKGILLNRAAP